MGKKRNKTLIIVLIIIGLIFILSLFNIAFSDFQCVETGCSGQSCAALPWGIAGPTTCEYLPQYGCLKDCKVRNFRCGFEPEYKQQCTNCILDCKTRFDVKGFSIFSQEQAEEARQNLNECFQICYES